MKKITMIFLSAVLVAGLCAVAVAGYNYEHTDVTAAKSNATVTVDLATQTGPTCVAFSAMSSKVIVRGKVGANTALINFTTLTATTRNNNYVRIITPIRYLFVRYTATGQTGRNQYTAVSTH